MTTIQHLLLFGFDLVDIYSRRKMYVLALFPIGKTVCSESGTPYGNAIWKNQHNNYNVYMSFLDLVKALNDVEVCIGIVVEFERHSYRAL